MATVRVAPAKVGRLVKVRLTDIDLAKRQHAAAQQRAFDWRSSLDPARDLAPGDHPTTTVHERVACLLRAVAIERAVIAPSPRGYLLPEDTVTAHAPEALDP